MKTRTLLGLSLLVLVAVSVGAMRSSAQMMSANAPKMRYLVVGANGPGFSNADSAQAVLEKGILPMFAALQKLEADKVIVAGGLPVGERTVTFIMEASSNAEVDNILHALPAWGTLDWKVTPLQSFAGRAASDRRDLDAMLK